MEIGVRLRMDHTKFGIILYQACIFFIFFILPSSFVSISDATLIQEMSLPLKRITTTGPQFMIFRCELMDRMQS
jgi:hypothetical protein